jgi:hypothetical protein
MATTFPTLSRGPSQIDIDLEDNSLRSDQEGGYVISRARYTRMRHIISLTYPMLTNADKVALNNFQIALMGGSDLILWTDPMTSIQYITRLDKPIKFKAVTTYWWSCDFKMNEA